MRRAVTVSSSRSPRGLPSPLDRFGCIPTIIDARTRKGGVLRIAWGHQSDDRKDFDRHRTRSTRRCGHGATKTSPSARSSSPITSTDISWLRLTARTRARRARPDCAIVEVVWQPFQGTYSLWRPDPRNNLALDRTLKSHAPDSVRDRIRYFARIVRGTQKGNQEHACGTDPEGEIRCSGIDHRCGYCWCYRCIEDLRCTPILCEYRRDHHESGTWTAQSSV